MSRYFLGEVGIKKPVWNGQRTCYVE